MTLSSRHRNRNSTPVGLRSSTLPLGHGGSPQYWLSHVDGEETFFVSFKPPRPGTEPRTLAWKAAVLTTTLGPPPLKQWINVFLLSNLQTKGWSLSEHWGTLFTACFLWTCLHYMVILRSQNKITDLCMIWAWLSRFKMKWNESGFRPPLCTYRLNWARRTSWGWWDDWDDTVLQTQERNSSPGGLRPSTLPLGHGGSPQYWLLDVDGEETFSVSFKPPRPGTEPRTLAWNITRSTVIDILQRVKASGYRYYF